MTPGASLPRELGQHLPGSLVISGGKENRASQVVCGHSSQVVCHLSLICLFPVVLVQAVERVLTIQEGHPSGFPPSFFVVQSNKYFALSTLQMVLESEGKAIKLEGNLCW